MFPLEPNIFQMQERWKSSFGHQCFSLKEEVSCFAWLGREGTNTSSSWQFFKLRVTIAAPLVKDWNHVHGALRDLLYLACRRSSDNATAAAASFALPPPTALPSWSGGEDFGTGGFLLLPFYVSLEGTAAVRKQRWRRWHQQWWWFSACVVK